MRALETVLRALYAPTRLINHKLHVVHTMYMQTITSKHIIAPHRYSIACATRALSHHARARILPPHALTACLYPATALQQSPSRKTRRCIRDMNDEYACVCSRNKIINPSRALCMGMCRHLCQIVTIFSGLHTHESPSMRNISDA